jgi:hypothetical protein
MKLGKFQKDGYDDDADGGNDDDDDNNNNNNIMLYRGTYFWRRRCNAD